MVFFFLVLIQKKIITFNYYFYNLDIFNFYIFLIF